MATVVAVAGFEHGLNTSASWIKGNAGFRYVDTRAGTQAIISPGRTGSYAVRISGSAATSFLGWGSGTFGASKTCAVGSVWLRFPTSLPAGNVMLVTLESASGSDLAIWFRASDDALMAGLNGGTGTPIVGPTVVADTWYQLDFRYTVSGTTHTIDWEVDGSAQTQFGKTGESATTLYGTQSVSLGWGLTAATATVDYDALVLSATSADSPLAPHTAALLEPDTAATATATGTPRATSTFTANGTLGTTFDSANLLTYTSEVPPTIGATASGFVQRTAGAGNAADVPMTSYTLGAGEAISGLRVEICGWAATTTANNLGVHTYNGTTDRAVFATADPNFDANTTTPGWVCEMATPADFDTQAELDALSIRIGYSTIVAPQPGAHGIYAEVAVYVPSTQSAAVTGTAVAALAGVPTPTVTVTLNAPVTSLTTVPAPTVKTGMKVTATAVAGTTAIAIPAVKTGATVPAVAVATTAAIPAPTVSAGSVLSPTAVAATTVVPTPVARGGATTAPTAVAATATVPAPTLSAGTAVSPTAVAAIAAVPTPTVQIVANAAVTEGAVAGTAAVPAPTVAGGATALTAAVAVTTAIATPTARGGAGVSPTVVAAAAAVAIPTVRGGIAVAPAPVAATAAVPSAVLSSTSPPLELSGFGTFTGVSAPDTIVSVNAQLTLYADAALEPFTWELWDGASA